MKKIAIAILLSGFVAAPAVAAGGYVGVNAGSAKIDLTGFDSTTSFGVFGGYAFNENFAAEVAYTNFGSKDYPAAGVMGVKSHAYSVSAVGSWPINEQFSLFGKLGFATTTLEATGFASTSKSDLTYGVGAQFNVNKQVGIRLGYDSYKVSDSFTNANQNVMSIGALFNF